MMAGPRRYTVERLTYDVATFGETPCWVRCAMADIKEGDVFRVWDYDPVADMDVPPPLDKAPVCAALEDASPVPNDMAGSYGVNAQQLNGFERMAWRK